MEDTPRSFWDKIIYDLALEDYITAYESGQYNAASKKKTLQNSEYELTTQTQDWFLNASGTDRVCPSCKNDKVTARLKDCYSWIIREIKSK